MTPNFFDKCSGNISIFRHHVDIYRNQGELFNNNVVNDALDLKLDQHKKGDSEYFKNSLMCFVGLSSIAVALHCANFNAQNYTTIFYDLLQSAAQESMNLFDSIFG